MSTDAQPASARSNDILWTAVGLLGVAAMGYFYVAPAIAKLKESRAAAQAKQNDVTAMTDQIAQIDQIGQQLAAQTESLKLLNLAVPATPAFDQLLMALAAMASQSGVELSTVTPAVGSTGASTPSASVSVKGTYTGIHLFLENAAKNIRPLTITNLGLAAATVEGQATPLITATMTMTAAQAVLPTDPAATPEGSQQ